jgi:hypothetical protein
MPAAASKQISDHQPRQSRYQRLAQEESALWRKFWEPYMTISSADPIRVFRKHNRLGASFVAAIQHSFQRSNRQTELD